MASIKNYIGQNQQRDCWADFETTKPINNSEFSWSQIKRKVKEDSSANIEGVIFPVVYLWNIRFRPDDILYWNKDGSFKNLHLLWNNEILKDVWVGSDDEPKKKIELKDIFKGQYEYLVFWGLRLESFLNFVKSIKMDLNIFFNNSKGFDAHYIITDELERKGWLYDPNNDNKMESTWSTITNKSTKIYCINFNNRFNAKYHANVQIKDSVLLFPLSIKKQGEMLSEHYTKINGDKEYWDKVFLKQNQHTNEVENYSQLCPFYDFNTAISKENEVPYFFQDTFILARFHEEMYSVLPRKYWKMTIGATAYEDWKRRLGKDIFEKERKYDYVEITKSKGFKVWASKKAFWNYEKGKISYDSLLKLSKPFNKLCSSFTDEIIGDTSWLDEAYDDERTFFEVLYDYYHGGQSWVNPDYQGIITDNVYVFDRKSSYPAEMHSDKDFPVWKPSTVKKKGYDWTLREVYIKRKITNSNGLPFLSYVDKKLHKRIYPKALMSGLTFFLTPEMWDYFLKYYKAKENQYDVKETFYFQTMKGNKIFGAYIDYWFKIKEQSKKEHNKFLELFAKLMLNSLYGKMATKKVRESKLWDTDDNIWTTNEEVIESKFYLPWAIQITSGAQLSLVEAVGDSNKYVVGGDTDSIFAKVKEIKTLQALFPQMKFVDPNAKNEIDNLGLYGQENNYWYYMLMRRSKQYFAICPKSTYFLKDNIKPLKMAFAGINANKPDEAELNDLNKERTIKQNLNIVDFIDGKLIPNQITPFVLDNHGTVLANIYKVIPSVWDYDDIDENEEFYISKIPTDLSELIFDR